MWYFGLHGHCLEGLPNAPGKECQRLMTSSLSLADPSSDSPAGRGIGHQIMCEEGYAFPGTMTVGNQLSQCIGSTAAFGKLVPGLLIL